MTPPTISVDEAGITIVENVQQAVTTYTEYFVADGAGGYEQAYDSAAEPLFVRST